jgi:hypothetical protein
MGSVVSYDEKCPNCGNENCISDYYYKSGEEMFSCPDCGYYYSGFYKRDKDGKLMKKDIEGPNIFDNFIFEEKIINKPYGCYRINYKDGVSSFGVFKTKKSYDKFLESSKTIPPECDDIISIEISRLYRKKIKKEKIFEKV